MFSHIHPFAISPPFSHIFPFFLFHSLLFPLWAASRPSPMNLFLPSPFLYQINQLQVISGGEGAAVYFSFPAICLLEIAMYAYALTLVCTNTAFPQHMNYMGTCYFLRKTARREVFFHLRLPTAALFNRRKPSREKSQGCM